MKENKCIFCKYKKPCPAKDIAEHGYKCETCIWNKLCKKEKRYDWPRRFLNSGLF